ncbi:fatty acid desaturase CarF family protein [Allitabrizicola rongguiensis]|uniref:fatty acid desaturase CarF family protein n=1 Tax=Alitabrizicola rongguiensis TaxID=2909234 RepID=UPI003873AE4B
MAVKVLLLILAADFVGCLYHWAEDTFDDVATPVWGSLFAAPNSHHQRKAIAFDHANGRRRWCATSMVH